MPYSTSVSTNVTKYTRSSSVPLHIESSRDLMISEAENTMPYSASVSTNTRNMKYSASVPSNMHSMLSERRSVWIDETDNLSGICVIKAHPLATKEMHVNFQASKDSLKIRFSQTRDGLIEYFNLCDLSLKGLVVGWIWGDSKVFVIAGEVKGELHHAIYCYPTDNLRNSWLLFFRSRGVRTAPFSVFQDHEKCPYLGPVNEHWSGEGALVQ